jgi:GT2 family glycosyltransferase
MTPPAFPRWSAWSDASDICIAPVVSPVKKADAGRESEARWGTSFRQRLRLAPLFLLLTLADRLRARHGGEDTRANTGSAAPRAWQPGISVIIPERDAPELLARALQSLLRALAVLDEPYEVIVVANGAPRDRYADILARYPALEFIHSRDALGFSAAISLGMQRARRDWTFLMNNDMTLEDDALSALARHRADDVFAIGAQIFQRSSDGRREETGFVDWYDDGSGIRVFHADPGDEASVREHLCASGGASLFRTVPLARYVRDSRCYDPFYWEDVEWGVRAHRDGMRVLYCPLAHAHHLHRATTGRFYSQCDIDRVIERNRMLFDARNAVSMRDPQWLMKRVCELDYEGQRRFARLGTVARVFQRRAHSAAITPPPRLVAPETVDSVELMSSYSFRLGPPVAADGERPVVLVVAPFCVFPARHGGARRIQGLLRWLRKSFAIVLITDEASLYDARSFAHFDGLHAVHLVQRPKDDERLKADDLAARMKSHCHPALSAAVRAAIVRYRPRVVQIEHAELAPLCQCRSGSERWVLGLHDAYGRDDFKDAGAAARYVDDIREGYAAVTVCSFEDQRLVQHPRVVCVPNGSSIEIGSPSRSSSDRLLFMGPFRYAQNFAGIRRFIDECYPRIKAALPQTELLVLGGDGARARVADDRLFARPGVHVVDYREDVATALAECSLTINPLVAIRGSSVKVIESLSAGRVCVSTEDGARGFLGDGLPGLVTVAAIHDMTDPIIRLLENPTERHRLEMPDTERLARYQWQRAAAEQARLYTELLDP